MTIKFLQNTLYAGKEYFAGEIWTFPAAIETSLISAGSAAVYPSFSQGTLASIQGASFDGLTDDYAAFNKALSIIGTNQAHLFITGPMLVGTNITVPANVQLWFTGAGKIKPGANITVTINGSFVAGPWQIFDVSNSGAVITGALKPIGGRLYTEHFGAVGDGVTDDSVAFQKTAKAAKDAVFLDIQLMAKTYLLTTTIYAGGANAQSFSAPNWYGMGKKNGTLLSYPSIASGTPCFKFRGGSGQLSGSLVSDIAFQGNSTSVGIEFAGVCDMHAVRCLFGTNAEGIRFHNEDSGAFTEYTTGDNCEFGNTCTLPVRYKRTSGNNSFHGSGLRDRCMCNNNAGGSIVQIDSGCLPYNAPFDLQLWSITTACTLFNSAVSSPNANFHGTITIEVDTTGGVTLASGHNVYFNGTINTFGVTTTTGANITAGTLVRNTGVALHVDSSTSATGYVRSNVTAMTTGDNTLTSGNVGHRLVALRLEASNYDYRYLLSVDHDGFGNAGYVTSIANYRALNTAAYGAPTFSVNTSGQLVITNGSFPGSGVTAYWGELAVGPGIQGSSQQQF